MRRAAAPTSTSGPRPPGRSETVLHLREAAAEAGDRRLEGGLLTAIGGDDVGDEVGQVAEVGFLHAVTGHLLGTQSDPAGRGEARVVVEGLRVGDDVVGLQPVRHRLAMGARRAQQALCYFRIQLYLR